MTAPMPTIARTNKTVLPPEWDAVAGGTVATVAAARFDGTADVGGVIVALPSVGFGMPGETGDSDALPGDGISGAGLIGADSLSGGLADASIGWVAATGAAAPALTNGVLIDSGPAQETTIHERPTATQVASHEPLCI